MSDADELMMEAQQQLSEHVEWLAAAIGELPLRTRDVKQLQDEARAIKLRMVRVDRGHASVVWDYPDHLAAFLRDADTPKHLRDTLAGGHVVSSEQPVYNARRE